MVQYYHIAIQYAFILLSGLANSTQANYEQEGEGEGLVYGGRNAGKGQFPWHVGIYRRVAVLPFDQKCGGSLISTRVVVTAAHCTGQSRNASSYRVVGGTLERSFNSEERGRQVRNVQDIIIHPHFVSENFLNDIALLILDTPMQKTTDVKPVQLDLKDRWTLTQLAAGREGLAAGWGKTASGRSSSLLQMVTLPYIDIRTCRDSLGPTLKKFATVEKICGGYVNRNISLCKGDSGGGFVFPVPGSDDEYILRGVVSLAFRPSNFEGECYAEHYTAFTRVTARSLVDIYHSSSRTSQGILAPVFGIPADYTEVPGYGFYKLHPDATFGNAWMTCLNEGANLAVFDSAAEATPVNDVVVVGKPAVDTKPYFFIGVHDMFVEGHFVDIFGKPLAHGIRWSMGEPNSHKVDEDCVIFKVQTRKLNDAPCDNPQPFLCKATIS